MVVPLDTIESLEETSSSSTSSAGEPVTESFPEPPADSMETVAGDRFRVEPSMPTLSREGSPPGGSGPGQNRWLYWVFGGCLTLILILMAGVAGFLFMSWQAGRGVAPGPEKSPPPIRVAEKKETPEAEVSPTPEATPSAEKTPEKEKRPEFEPDKEPAEEENLPEDDELKPEKPEEKEPEVSFTPPKKPTRQGSFRVRADRGWQLSEINTVPSEVFRTSVRGMIVLDGIEGSIPPDGISGQRRRRIYRQFPTGALLMRTRFANGKVGNIMPATRYDQWQNYKNESGRLEFLINDNSPENNRGSFVITVRLVSAPE